MLTASFRRSAFNCPEEVNGELSNKSTDQHLASKTRLKVKRTISTWKSKGCRDSGHGDADEMVEIAICWIRQLQRSVRKTNNSGTYSETRKHNNLHLFQ